MEDFVIHRGAQPEGRPDKQSPESRVMEILRAIDYQQTFLKKLNQFRMEFADYDFDLELNACKLYYMNGEKVKVLEILDEIRRKIVNYGENLLMKRMEKGEEMGLFDALPHDVLKLILN